MLDTGLFGDLPAAGPEASRLRAAPPIAPAWSMRCCVPGAQQPGAVRAIADSTRRRSDMESVRPICSSGCAVAGIEVVAVDVERLRAPDAAFAAFWQLVLPLVEPARPQRADWPNPLGVGPAGRIDAALGRSCAAISAAIASCCIADDGAGALSGLIFSRPLQCRGRARIRPRRCIYPVAALEPLLESEFALAQFSGWSDGGAMQARSQRCCEQQRQAVPPRECLMRRARVWSARALIAEALVARIDAAGKRDSIDIAALYLSQRELVRALLDAARRGVTVRLLLDPGKDGYGYERSGHPEPRSRLGAGRRPATAPVRVRWYRTHGEQFSPGLVLIRRARRAPG